jgi:hypothetical protein
VIEPVVASIVNPVVEEKTPPVVPVNVTLWPVANDLQNGEPPYEIVAAGAVVIVTDVVVENATHPPAAAIVYVTVYVPSVLVEGVIAPVEALIINPAAEEYVPPVVPVNVTGWTADVIQKVGPLYAIVAVGAVVMVTNVVAEKAEHPPAAAMVYVTVYVPAVLVDGVIAPVDPSIVNPDVEEYVPPVVPVNVTPWPVANDLQNGEPL